MRSFFTPICQQILTNLRPPSPLQNANVFYWRPYDYREDSYICIPALVLIFFGKNHQTQRKLLSVLWKVIAIFSKLLLSTKPRQWCIKLHLIQGNKERILKTNKRSKKFDLQHNFRLFLSWMTWIMRKYLIKILSFLF